MDLVCITGRHLRLLFFFLCKFAFTVSAAKMKSDRTVVTNEAIKRLQGSTSAGFSQNLVAHQETDCYASGLD